MRVDAYKDKRIYFLRRADGVGPVKIGCSISPAKRLEKILLWSPYPLMILATFPGDNDLERALHSRFAEHQFHHEWFHPAPELIDAIARISAGVPVEDAVDLTIQHGSIRSQAIVNGWATRRAKRQAA